MNSLNSVLIEGALIQDPMMVEKFGKPVCTFKLVSTRYAKNNEGERVQALSFFEIDVHNRAEIAKCMAELKEGRGVRVVGRMMTERFHDRGGVEHHKMIIIGESTSIKPAFDRTSEVQS